MYASTPHQNIPPRNAGNSADILVVSHIQGRKVQEFGRGDFDEQNQIAPRRRRKICELPLDILSWYYPFIWKENRIIAEPLPLLAFMKFDFFVITLVNLTQYPKLLEQIRKDQAEAIAADKNE